MKTAAYLVLVLTVAMTSCAALVAEPVALLANFVQ